MAMLEIQDIHKSFYTYDDKPRFHLGPFPRGSARRVASTLNVLRGVDLTVEKGDVVAILGPSGSGKTTLLRCLNFLEPADSGHLVFDGETFDLGKITKADIARLRKKTAFVFQNYNLFRNKTALQNVTEGLIVARKTPKEEADAIGRKMLEKVGLADRADYYPRQLSGGQQQRVAIARALVKMPRVLLLDEPLSNLDARLRLQTREEIRRIQKETKITTVFVTHDQEEAMSISDMIVVMKSGVVQQIGKPQDVYDNPANLFVANFLGTPPINIFTGHVKGERLFIGVDNVMDVPGVKDQDVFVGIRPEGFILDMEFGTLCCKPQNVEVMGRDVSVVSTHEASQKPTVRSIIDADNKVDASADVVRYRIKPHKIFLFTRDDEGIRIPFEVK